MSRSQKITIVVSALVVAGLVAVAAPTVVSVASELGGWAVFKQPAAATALAPKSTDEPEIDEALENSDGYVYLGYGTSIPVDSIEGCEAPAYLFVGSAGDEPVHAVLLGADLVDTGAREFAAGMVGLDEQGRPATYTVAPGDVPSIVGDRFCIYNGQALASINHTRTIHPGQVLRLNPDPTVHWIPYFNPTDAPAGFLQIPYQAAIEEMGSAADADDLETMRAIWANELSAMFTRPVDIAAIEQALNAGDMDILRKMFS